MAPVTAAYCAIRGRFDALVAAPPPKAQAMEGYSAMTTIDNLRSLKQQLQKQLKESPSADQSEWIEGELTKIEIALSFLDEAATPPSSRPAPK